MAGPLIAAMAQMRVDGGALDANLDRACERIAEAKALGAAVAVLPECCDLGWTHPSARELAQPIPGPSYERIARAARTNGMYVAAGLTERDGGAIHNAAVLIGPGGDLLLKHRKVTILDIARDLYTPGQSLAVVETPIGVIGLAICADNFPESICLAQSLVSMGARLILSPCAWAVPADYDNAAEPYGALWIGAYGTITRESNATVIGVSNVGPIAAGPWVGRRCIGASLAMGPGAQVLARGPYGVTSEAMIPVSVPRFD